jgi:hypothetical protein
VRIDLFNMFGYFNKANETKNREKIQIKDTITLKLPNTGQVVKGQIEDIQQNKVSIRLEDGQLVEARMTENFEFVIGDKLSFLVKESSPDQLLLKPLIEGDLADAKISDILKNAGLSDTDKNKEIVLKLLEKQMPINKKSLTDLAMFSKRFPNAKIDHLVFLTKNDIMISNESIHYVNELLKGKQNMSSTITSFNAGVAEIVDQPSGALVVETILKDNEPATTIFSKIKNFFLKSEEQVKVPSEKLNIPLNKVMSSLDAESINKEMHQMKTFEGTMLSKELQNTDSNTAIEKYVLEKGKAFNELFTMVEELDIPEDIKAATNKLFAQRVTKAMLNNEMLMKKEDLANVQEVNKHYGKVYNKIIDVLNLNLQDSSESIQKVLQDAYNVKHSVEMMNQLNNNYQFVHLPIVLNDQNVNSELYIMNNKKSKNDMNQRVTALLRLDMRNLGHLDIYVAKTRDEVEVNFYVDNATTEKDVSLLKHKLTQQLLEKSFQVLGIGVLLKEKDVDVLNHFFEQSEDSADSKRFTFDMRA